MPSDKRIYVIDDDAAMRESLKFLLDTNGFSVSLFESAASFLEAAPTIEFGCVVTDLKMPEIDGFELLRRMRADNARIPVVMMTGHGDIPLAVEAMKLGAVDFIEKPFDDKRLIKMIQTALQIDADRVRAQSEMDSIAKRIKSLSKREKQVMEGILAGHSNKVIARDYGISPRTVEVYRAHVMTKMRAESLPDLIRLAFRAGILRA